MLYLKNLETLHADMTRHGQTRRGFRWNTRRNGHVFDVVFLTDMREGLVLIFGLIGSRFAFELAVNESYEINTFLGDNYRKLMDALGLEIDRMNPFSPNAFFGDFARNIPREVNETTTVTSRDIRQTRHVEEADKTWFLRWNPNGERAHVTAANLAKTELYFGSIARYCAEQNISSCWSDKPTGVHDSTPPGYR